MERRFGYVAGQDPGVPAPMGVYRSDDQEEFDPITTTILTQSDLEAMVEHLVGAGVSVIAPVPAGRSWETTEFQLIRMGEATLGGGLPAGLARVVLPRVRRARPVRPAGDLRRAAVRRRRD